MTDMKDCQYICFTNMAEWRDKAVVFNTLTNSVFLLDKDTYRVNRRIDLPIAEKLPDNGISYVQRIRIYGDTLHMFPDITTRSVISYNLVSGEIKLNRLIDSGSVRYHIPATGFEYDRYYVQLVNEPYREFYVFDMEKARYVNSDKANRLNKALKCEKGKMMSILYRYGTRLYIGLYDEKRILWVDWENEEYGEVILPKIPAGDMLGFVADDHDYWIYFDGSAELIRQSVTDDNDYDFIGIKDGIYPMIDYRDRLLICRWERETYRNIEVLNKKDYKIYPLKDRLPENFRMFDDVRAATEGAYDGYCVYDDGVRLYPGAVNMMLDIDMDNYSISGRHIFMEDDGEEYVVKRIMEFYKDKIIPENDILRYGIYDNGIDYLLKYMNLRS